MYGKLNLDRRVPTPSPTTAEEANNKADTEKKSSMLP
jgi:hypothetical protein